MWREMLRKRSIRKTEEQKRKYSHCLSCHYTAGFHYGGTAEHREHLPLTWLTLSKYTHQNISAHTEQSFCLPSCVDSTDMLVFVHISLFIPFLLLLFPVTPIPTCLTAARNKTLISKDLTVLTFRFYFYFFLIFHAYSHAASEEICVSGQALGEGSFSLSALPPCI